MSFSQPLPRLGYGFSFLASVLDPRSAPRLAKLFAGALLAKGRRTVTSWIRAVGLSAEYRCCYTTRRGGRAPRRVDRGPARPPRPRTAPGRGHSGGPRAG
jgi:hypothetical protein